MMYQLDTKSWSYIIWIFLNILKYYKMIESKCKGFCNRQLND